MQTKYSYSILWGDRIVSGHGYTSPKAAERARQERLRRLKESEPRPRRTVAVRREPVAA